MTSLRVFFLKTYMLIDDPLKTYMPIGLRHLGRVLRFAPLFLLCAARAALESGEVHADGTVTAVALDAELAATRRGLREAEAAHATALRRVRDALGGEDAGALPPPPGPLASLGWPSFASLFVERGHVHGGCTGGARAVGMHWLARASRPATLVRVHADGCVEGTGAGGEGGSVSSIPGAGGAPLSATSMAPQDRGLSLLATVTSDGRRMFLTSVTAGAEAGAPLTLAHLCEYAVGEETITALHVASLSPSVAAPLVGTSDGRLLLLSSTDCTVRRAVHDGGGGVPLSAITSLPASPYVTFAVGGDVHTRAVLPHAGSEAAEGARRACPPGLRAPPRLRPGAPLPSDIVVLVPDEGLPTVLWAASRAGDVTALNSALAGVDPCALVARFPAITAALRQAAGVSAVGEEGGLDPPTLTFGALRGGLLVVTHAGILFLNSSGMPYTRPSPSFWAIRAFGSGEAPKEAAPAYARFFWGEGNSEGGASAAHAAFASHVTARALLALTYSPDTLARVITRGRPITARSRVGRVHTAALAGGAALLGVSNVGMDGVTLFEVLLRGGGLSSPPVERIPPGGDAEENWEGGGVLGWARSPLILFAVVVAVYIGRRGAEGGGLRGTLASMFSPLTGDTGGGGGVLPRGVAHREAFDEEGEDEGLGGEEARLLRIFRQARVQADVEERMRGRGGYDPLAAEEPVSSDSDAEHRKGSARVRGVRSVQPRPLVHPEEEDEEYEEGL